MAYLHGIYNKEISTSVAIPTITDSGVVIAIGTAPVNMAEDPYSTVNKPFYAETFADAMEQVGYSSDHENYTLCAVMDLFFKKFQVGPIVLINVLDPSRHTKGNDEAAYAVSNMQATIDIEGIIPSTMVVKYEDTELTSGTDYIYSFDDDGYVVISLMSSGAAAAAESITVSSTSIDPTQIVADDIIGGYDSDTGLETGCELIRQVWPLYQRTPSLLIAPGWSHLPAVGSVLAIKSEEINGKFRCENVLDLDTEEATKYTDCAALKADCGYTSETSILCWPKVVIDDEQYYYSAVWAAMAIYTDVNNNGIPMKSPSNELLKVSGAVLADGTEINMDLTQANVLNGDGIVTAVNDGGWRAWGNNTAAYPDNTDPKDRWICCRRMFSWYGNRLIVAYRKKVDSPVSYRMIEALIDTENLYLNSLTPDYIAGGSVSFNEDDNPIEQILDGKVVFGFKLGFYTPAEVIENQLEFDASILESALTQEESEEE